MSKFKNASRSSRPVRTRVALAATALALLWTGSGCSAERKPALSTLGKMTTELRHLVDETCKTELDETTTDLSPFENYLPPGRPVLKLGCVHATIIYLTDDGSLFNVASPNTLTTEEAHRWLDALVNAGMPAELRERARQRLAANEFYPGRDRSFETADGAVDLYLMGNLQNGGQMIWSVTAHKWKW
jgi:hypothetical protein